MWCIAILSWPWVEAAKCPKSLWWLVWYIFGVTWHQAHPPSIGVVTRWASAWASRPQKMQLISKIHLGVDARWSTTYNSVHVTIIWSPPPPRWLADLVVRLAQLRSPWCDAGYCVIPSTEQKSNGVEDDFVPDVWFTMMFWIVRVVDGEIKIDGNWRKIWLLWHSWDWNIQSVPVSFWVDWVRVRVRVFDVIFELIASSKFWCFKIFELIGSSKFCFLMRFLSWFVARSSGFCMIFELICSSKFSFFDAIFELISSYA